MNMNPSKINTFLMFKKVITPAYLTFCKLFGVAAFQNICNQYTNAKFREKAYNINTEDLNNCLKYLKQFSIIIYKSIEILIKNKNYGQKNMTKQKMKKNQGQAYNPDLQTNRYIVKHLFDMQ